LDATQPIADRHLRLDVDPRAEYPADEIGYLRPEITK
jgi:hypothetical protein